MISPGLSSDTNPSGGGVRKKDTGDRSLVPGCVRAGQVGRMPHGFEDATPYRRHA